MDEGEERLAARLLLSVMAGLVPAIHVLLLFKASPRANHLRVQPIAYGYEDAVGGRDKPGHDLPSFEHGRNSGAYLPDNRPNKPLTKYNAVGIPDCSIVFT